MQRSTILALSLLAFGALLPAACTQNFNVFEPSGGTGGTSSSSSSASSSSSSSGAGGCMADSDCSDSNPCTTDACDKATRKCSNVALADGPVPGFMDTMMDCKTQGCVSGMQQTINADSEVPDDGNPCTTDSCMGGAEQHPNASASTVCGMASGTNLICDGMGHCVGCTMDKDCNDPGVCKTRTCDATGQCQFGNQGAHQMCQAGVCDGNGDCVGCVDGNDCSGTTHGVCENNACIDQCADSMKNGAETDVDCGGGTCDKCGTNKDCSGDGDCQTGYCNPGGKCKAPSCNDGAKDGTETDVDCGGPCPNCANGKMCLNGGDCVSGHCGGGVCGDPCADGVKDNAETDVDCGGGTCGKCANTKMCNTGFDCTGGDCYHSGGGAGQKTCHGDLCSDGVKDAMETDVDCAGPCATKCATGKGCAAGGDCTSTFCNTTSSLCVATQCLDGVKNGAETDIDCGGGTCSTCAYAKACAASTDCASALCDVGGTLKCQCQASADCPMATPMCVVATHTCM